MAATQAEPHQNDVNRDLNQQEQTPLSANNSLQNGTDKSSGRGVIGSEVGGAKGIKPVQNISVDMSQYRQDSGPPVNNSEQNSNNSDDGTGKINNSDKSFSHNSEQSSGEVNYGKGTQDGGQTMQGYGLPFPQRGGYMHPEAGNPMHMGGDPVHHQTNSYGHFNPNMRHGGYGGGGGGGGAKPLPPARPPAGTGAPVPPAPTASSAPPFPPHSSQQQRFLPGQSISPPTGPTPTLNQLLQSSNSVHRYQNSYSDYGMQKPGEQPQPSMGVYNQSWPPPRPMPPYPPQQPAPAAYRNPPPGGRGYNSGSGSPGGNYPPPPSASPSQPTGPPYAPQPYRHPYQMGGPPSNNGSYPASGAGSAGGGGGSTGSGAGGGVVSGGAGGGDSRGAWSPGPSPNQPPPQHNQPPSPQHQNYQNRQAEPSPTPNAHAPDPGDLTGQNSNDSSSGGPAPGTPNSQGMRPTPSPTGSTGSRSMSPAVGQQNIAMPPRPSSGQSDTGNGPTRMSHSPMANQGGYPGQGLGVPPPPPPHMHNYKLGGAPSGNMSGAMGGPPPPGHQMPPHPHAPPPPQSQQMPPYSNQPPPQPSPHQYPQQGSYGGSGVRAPGMASLGYSQGYGSQGPPGSGMPQAQYPPPRPIPNHVPHSQYPPSPYQGWGNSSVGGGPGGPGGGKPVGGGGGGPSPSQSPQQPQPQQQQQSASNNAPTPRSHTPPHYLKHHLQHKVGGYGSNMPPSPGSYNSHGGVGPMGPPPPSAGQAGLHHPGMPPPPPPHHDGPMPPPPPASTPTHDMHDNTITTTATGTVISSQSVSGSVTSIVTTGPDGAPLDEASQQSTLSNASAASGDDPSCTPGKNRKEGSSGMMGHHSHPTTPQSTAPSPGAASLNSMHEEYPPDHSPTWTRTPASPVFNSIPQDLYRPKKHDSLGKLYEMDDSHERRLWLDKLLHFMEDRGTPISACPTISKNPLDLFRLYLYVKERGGFMEVCKVTKNKIWKDIAGLLGIGASSSAAYTLRKHYTKNLLPFECHFDRGGIDPQPIINQVEATSKKKGAKAAPVPSPGSSNSQDSFQGPGSGGGGMDGYGFSYSQEYNNQRPPSQSNQGMQGAGYQGPSGYQYNEQYGQQYPTGSYPPPNRPMYPPYGPESERGYGQGSSGNNSGTVAGTAPGSSGSTNQASTTQQDFGRYMGGTGGANSGSAGYPGRGGYPPQPPQSSSGGSASGTPPQQPQQPPQQQQQQQQQQPPPQQQPYPQQPPPGPPPPTQDYYRDQVYPGGGQGSAYPGAPSKTMPPPAPQPRRHPDFVKDQQPYPSYNQQRPNMYPGIPAGWSNNNNTQYNRGQYPGGGSPGGPPQQWNQGPPRPGGAPPPPPNHQPNTPQWGQPQYQSPQSQQGWPMGSPAQSSPLRPPLGPRPPFRPDSKQFGPMAPPGIKGPGMGGFGPQVTGHVKRELVFPVDSVEATTPVLYKRRRLGKSDVAPIEAWRIMMALKSGLLAETTWALDVLNILLFDDSTIAYFGLIHLPGLMDILLEHMKRALGDMLEPSPGHPSQWYEEAGKGNNSVDLGAVNSAPDPSDRVNITKSALDYTNKSRKGHPVSFSSGFDDIFVTDGRRIWDSEETVEEAGEQDSSKYIVTCFRTEFGKIPFVRMLSGPDRSKDNKEYKSEDLKPDIKELQRSLEDEKPSHTSAERGSKKKVKTLGDALSRIKKEESASDLQSNPEPIKEEVPTDTEEPKEEEKPMFRIRDPAGTLKRRRISDYEDECYIKDEASLYVVTESQDSLARRCVCLSTILRNLTFVPGNEIEFSKSGTFLGLVGKLLLLHHEHPPRAMKQRNYDRDEDVDFTDCCSSLQGDSEWWWEFLHHLRENALVSIANIAGHVDLGLYPEDISRPILDGLLHWAVCPSAQGQDPFPTVSPSSSLSPQRLALEALCKLCVTDSNVDLVIATPPYCRLERLASVLTRLLCRSEEQVLREFGVNLLYYLGAADSGMARTIAAQSPCVSLLVGFIEQAEQSALGVANQHGLNALRDNPDSMGTSLDMLRRAARTLLHLSKHPDNWPLFLQQEQRLLALVMSQILDQQVASVISTVLYQCSRGPDTPHESESS